MPLAELAAALGELGLVSTRRMDVFDRPDGVTVIDDSYNANPASMAVGAAGAGRRSGRGRRTVAVLGYMAELGAYERDGHAEVGRLAAELGVDRLLVVGEPAAPIHDGATAVADWGGESVLLTDQAAAVEVLRSELRPGDVVLVKGSRYRTWEVADALRADAATARRRATPHEGGHRRRRGRRSWSRCSAPRSRSRCSPGSRPASRSGPTGPASHQGKKGTPDDGRRGLHPRHGDRVRRRAPRPDHPAGRSRSPRSSRPSPALVLLGLFVFSGAVGFLDDFLKVRKRNSAGLNKRGKLLGQILVGAVFGVVALYFPST